MRLIKKYLRLDDESASIGYDFYIAKHGEGVLSLPERSGLEFVITEVAKTNPKAAGATPESLNDRTEHPGRNQKERVYRTAERIGASTQ